MAQSKNTVIKVAIRKGFNNAAAIVNQVSIILESKLKTQGLTTNKICEEVSLYQQNAFAGNQDHLITTSLITLDYCA